MADKKITDLPVAGTLTDDGLLVVYQDEKTESIKGILVKEYAVAAAKEQADAATESAAAASASKAAAEEAAAGVESAKEAAAESASAAIAAQGKAQTAQNAAETAAASAGASVSAVLEAKAAAEEAQSKAEAAQQGAITAQAAAESAKSGSDASRDSAEAAKAAAETAQADAEAAKTVAQTAKEAAETAKAGAEEAKTGAETARQAVENLGVSAETGEPGAEATVQKTVTDTGTVNLKFTLPRGEQGPHGEQGTPGSAGADGKSAYQQAKEGGYTGTETEFNKELAGISDAMKKTDYDASGAVSKAGGITDWVGNNFLSAKKGGTVEGPVEFALSGTFATPFVSINQGLFFCDSVSKDTNIAVRSPYDAEEQGTKNVLGFFGDSTINESKDDTIGTTPVILRNIAPPKEITDAARMGYVDTMTGGTIVVGSDGVDYARMGLDPACIHFMCPAQDVGTCGAVLQEAINVASEKNRRLLILTGKYYLNSALDLVGCVYGNGSWRRGLENPTVIVLGPNGTMNLVNLQMCGIVINGSSSSIGIGMGHYVHIRECFFDKVTANINDRTEIEDCLFHTPSSGVSVYIEQSQEDITIKNCCFKDGGKIEIATDEPCYGSRIMDNYFKTAALTEMIPTLSQHEVYLRGNYCPDYKATSQMSRYDTPSKEIITVLKNLGLWE